jgi:hypothetical protein
MAYIHGLHCGSVHDGYGSTGAGLMRDRPGWLVFTEIASPTGGDYSEYAAQGFNVLVRLNHGYYPNGTIPVREFYPEFAVTCALHVQASRGVYGWIIGNEPNHSQERPDGWPITAEDYADCFRGCRDTIHSYVPDARVIVGAVAPYNAQTGDFGDYQVQALYHLGAGNYDGVALHAYTHGPDPALITSAAKMGPPFENYHYHFRVYRDLAQRVPANVPLYLTETNQDEPWWNVNVGWVREMYREIDEWNTDNPSHVIRCACLFRYPTFDQWSIADKPAVIEDFQQAVDIGYTWTGTDPDPPEPEPEPEPEPPEEDDMVTINDGFENGFYAYQGEGELTCPTGWTPVWQDDPQVGILDRPEFKPAGAAQIRNGSGAVAIHSRYQTINGAIVRSFNVDTGAAVQASVWMMKEGEEGGHAMRIGIDPTGGTLITSGGIIWSEWYSQYSNDWSAGDWRQRDVGAVAQSNIVTVFLQSRLDVAVDGSHAHFDDCVIQIEGYVPPDPDPDPEPEPDPDPDPIETLKIELFVNGDRVFLQEYRPEVTSVVLKPVGSVLAQLMQMFTSR